MSNVIDLQSVKESALSNMSIADMLVEFAGRGSVLDTCVVWRDDEGLVHVMGYEDMHNTIDMISEAMEALIYTD